MPAAVRLYNPPTPRPETIMLELSRRVRELGTENAFVVLGEVAKLQAEGAEIVSFCIGQPDFVTPDRIRMAAVRAIVEGRTGYTPSPGIPELRRAAAAYLTRTRHVQVEPDDVVCGCGAKPFIAYAIASVTDHGAGHEVIYPNPGFPIYDSQIRASGAVPVPLPLRASRGFGFDLDELSAKLSPRTRLLILCSPHNPTGAVLHARELESIASMLRPLEHVWVFSDEPYSALVYDGEFQSIVAAPGMQERTIVVDSASKTYAMTGWRVGWAANRMLAASFTRWVTNTDSCPPHPNQWAVVEALDGPQDDVEQMRRVFHERRDRIVNGLNAIDGVSCQTPGGAFYVWPDVTEACRRVGTATSEELRRRLLHEAGVAVLADVHFGRPVEGEGQHLRFSYASSLEAIDEGLERFSAFMRKNGR
jgi:aspartate/methionine/tyrosine aminotransferase